MVDSSMTDPGYRRKCPMRGFATSVGSKADGGGAGVGAAPQGAGREKQAMLSGQCSQKAYDVLSAYF